MPNLLPGKLAYVFMVSIVDAALLSLVVLWWYRRAVRRLMTQRAQAAPDASGGAADLGLLDATPHASVTFCEPETAGADARTSRIRAAAVLRLVAAYGAGAAVYSAIMTVLQLGTVLDAHVPAVWFGTWAIGLWPLIPTLVTLLVVDVRGTFKLTLGFVAAVSIGCALVTFVAQVLRWQFNSAPITNAYFIVYGLVAAVWLPLPLVLLIGARRVRAVAPLALAVTLVFGLALSTYREALERAFNDAGARDLLLRLAVLTSVNVATYGLFMVAALPFGYGAWRLLRWLAGAFRRRRFSDLQLVVDCGWIVATADLVATHLAAQYGLAAIAAGVSAFAAYRAVVALVLWCWRPDAVSDAPRLLLLRVFGHQARTEALFDRVAGRWRFRGPVQLIAGVDLAGRTIDPADTLQFIRGRLRDHYVQDVSAIPARVADMERGVDPDGRFRVNELYCHADTWQPTLTALLEVSDAVLIDLRSFSRRNAGCVFELQQIVERVSSDRIVIVYDATTDLPFVRDVLNAAWAPAVAAGRAKGSGQIGVVRVDAQSRAGVQAVMRRLCDPAAPSRPVALA